MKKLLLLLWLCFLLASAVPAQRLISARGAGMGGTGVAASQGLAAAYYNPACLLKTDNRVGKFETALGAAYTKLETLFDAFAKTTSPAQFLLDSYALDLDFQGNISGIIGISSRKIGLSVIPYIDVTVDKPASSLAGRVNAAGAYDATLTLGRTFSPSCLPAALDVGLNVKAINAVVGTINALADPVDPSKAGGYQAYGTGLGLGFDLGALTYFTGPLASRLAVGGVIRNLGASYNLNSKVRYAYIDKTTGQVTLDAESALPDQNVSINSTVAFGLYTTLPANGLGIAADLELTRSGTNTHFGLEYPLLRETLFLRAGLASGPDLALTTYGLALDLRFLDLGITRVSDAKNPALSRAFADITIGF
jgi:hypothetical protein